MIRSGRDGSIGVAEQVLAGDHLETGRRVESPAQSGLGEQRVEHDRPR